MCVCVCVKGVQLSTSFIHTFSLENSRTGIGFIVQILHWTGPKGYREDFDPIYLSGRKRQTTNLMHGNQQRAAQAGEALAIQ